TQLAALTTDGVLRVWDCDSGKLLQTLETPPGSIHVFAFDSTGKRLYTGGSDGTVSAWSLDEDGRPTNLGSDPSDAVVSLAVSPDGEGLGVVWFGGRVVVRDAKTLRPRSEMKAPGTRRVLFSPDNRTLAVLSHTSGRLQLWDALEGKELHLLNTMGYNYGAAF